MLESALAQAKRLAERAPLIDGHNDIPWRMREQKPRYDFDVFDLRQPRPGFHTDIPRLRAGGMGGAFWSVYVPGTLQGESAVTATLEQIDAVQEMLRRYPDVFEAARTAADVERIAKAGRIASMMGMEGGHSIDKSLGALRTLSRLGVGYMTLTHNVTLPWADSAMDVPRNGGLTPVRRGGGPRDEPPRHARRPEPRVAGHHARRAARQRSAGDLLALVGAGDLRRAPQRARRRPRRGEEERRRRDGHLRARLHRARGRAPLREARGRARAAEGAAAVDAGGGDRRAWRRGTRPTRAPRRRCRRSPTTSTTSARSPASITSGSAPTSTAWTTQPDGLDDVSKYPALLAELLQRGYSDDDVQKIAGRNVLRAMRGAEAVAQQLQKARKPSLATIDALDGAAKK